jgi:phosphate transport system protein
MPFGFLRNPGGDRLEHIEEVLQRMFADDRHAFDLAMSALLGGAAPKSVGTELRATDHQVNEAEREIRRELVVHASVHGGVDTPSVLVYMSIVNDVERIGDYAKNIFDLAADGVSLHDDADAEALFNLRDEVSRMITDVAGIFRRSDTEAARRVLARGDELLDDFDERVSALVRGDDQGPHAVATALPPQ